MQPLINSKGCYTKDRVFIVRSSIFKPVEGTIQRGDVVSLISPKKYDECYIKRVVGLPGDVVKTISYKKVSDLSFLFMVFI
jgi:signal peptidase I